MTKKIKFNLKAIIWFLIAIIITYGMIYLLTPGDFFKSPMYMLLPLVGFFVMFYITEYIMKYIHLKNKYIFLGIFIVLGIIAYYLAIFFFYWNIITLNNIPAKELFKFVFGNTSLILTTAFLEFIVAGAFGIIASK